AAKKLHAQLCAGRRTRVDELPAPHGVHRQPYIAGEHGVLMIAEVPTFRPFIESISPTTPHQVMSNSVLSRRAWFVTVVMREAIVVAGFVSGRAPDRVGPSFQRRVVVA